ncbi:MAG: hypothetical protein IT371_24720 [Deltaproteobacteria bacterium]|nr:hypothetical protein [Deltaproteobacteria bacterium]
MRGKDSPRFVFVLALAGAVTLAGCHWMSGREEGASEYFVFCDRSGCYRCTRAGCELPGAVCDAEGCPAGSTCHPSGKGCVTSCTEGAGCQGDLVCVDGRCAAAPSPCTDEAGCGEGAYCDSGVCRKTGRCKAPAECARFGQGFECDPGGSCVPPVATPPALCQSGAACGDGMCVSGQCGACQGDCGSAKTCELDRHCGAGRACLDGKCTSACAGPEACGSGQVCRAKVCVPDPSPACQTSAQCGAGKACVNNLCLPECTATGLCGRPTDLCGAVIQLASGSSVRVCRADHRARPECAISANCVGGGQCVNGICRTVCEKPADCAGCKDGPVCGKGGYCMTQLEAAPQCGASVGCADGKSCLGGQCVAL